MIVLSLGAGVQSTTLALMAAEGIIEAPDCAIFADTKWEPKAVYRHLEWLTPRLPFPVHIVSAGDLRADTLARSNTTGGRFSAVPWYTLDAKGQRGMGRRQCTREYKIRPIQRKIVELMGSRHKGGAELWIGISTDEAARMKPSLVGYIVNRWPLIEQGVSRRDCKRWLEHRGYQVPRSSCIACPFHSDDEWRALTGEEFADAVMVDAAIRKQSEPHAQQFVHRSCVPLDQVDLRTAGQRGQTDLFINECEGMCGV